MQLCGESVHFNDIKIKRISQRGSTFFLKHFIFNIVSYYEPFQLEVGFTTSCREPDVVDLFLSKSHLFVWYSQCCSTATLLF